MSGIYFHIPFCRKACSYCDFHFSTSLAHKDTLIAAMKKEIDLRLSGINWPALRSVYFGGGTPSILNAEEIEKFIDLINRKFSIDGIEITLEANPDDLNKSKLQELKSAGINRLSIGVQSFFEEDLLWMNRSHNAQQAEQCLLDAADIGFESINADLIFGYPLLSNSKWDRTIEKMLSFPVNHLSTYSMTVEPKTALAYAINKKKEKPMLEGQAEIQYRQIMKAMQNAGWEHYEVSNFCKPGQASIHNSAYWQGEEYLGIGPSAHGYNGKERYWNIANNAQYHTAMHAGKLPEERETLTTIQKHNEYLLTRLRTISGIQLADFSQLFGETLKIRLLHLVNAPAFYHYFERSNKAIIMNQEGFLLADYLIGELFLLEED